MPDPTPPLWLKPMNKVMMAAQKLGIVAGPVRVLTVPGRKSGELRSTPATPFTLHDGLYVVGGYPKADWVLNARAAGAKAFADTSPPAEWLCVFDPRIRFGQPRG